MTLALLLTAVTGAWATDVYVVGNGTGNWLNGVGWDTSAAENKMTEQNGVYSITFTNVDANSELLFKFAINGTWDVNYGCISTDENELNKTLSNIEEFGNNILFGLTEQADVTISFNLSELTYMISTKGMKVGDDASSGPTVAWNASTKTGTFSMPGSDVVLTPIYANAATFATTGTEPEATTLLPAAAEGVIAGTDASLIAEGTGIVAFAGTSTEVTQGTLMYAVGTSATEAPALTAFSATVPTAKDYDDAATVYVWYYIKGADAPDGEAATLDNTFDDTEPACLTVTVLTNKFDITLNAANANTIEAGKATVTVGGTAATVTDGKLEGVKMGSEVKLEANPGYKFRKVEVKKGAGDTGKSLAEATVGMIVGSNGKAYAADDKDNLPEGVTAVAKVCYVDGNGHGLALALTDEEGEMDWSTAMETCTAHTPAITGGTWKLASQDEWNSMINAAGTYSVLRNGFSSVGGMNMLSVRYWSSSEYDSSRAWSYRFSSGDWKKDTKASSSGYLARACLAF